MQPEFENFVYSRQEGELLVILRLLMRQFGTIDEATRSQITNLPLPLLEEFAEALLDFSDLDAVRSWLQTHAV